MKRILVLLVFITVSTFSYSQNYKTAIGIKGGYPGYGSLNGKHFLNSKTAIEGSIGGGTNTLWLQGLYELNFSLEDLERGPIAKRKRMRDQAGMNTPVQTCHARSVFATSERIM